MPSTGLSIFSTDHDGGYEGASDYQPDDPLSSRSTFYRLGLGFSGIIDHVAHQMSLKSSPRKRNLRDKKK